MKITTINPATEEIIQEYETFSSDKVFGIVKHSYSAYEKWKQLSIEKRAAYFRKLAKIT